MHLLLGVVVPDIHGSPDLEEPVTGWHTDAGAEIDLFSGESYEMESPKSVNQ